MSARAAAGDAATVAAVAAFLYREAELLDERRLREWLELYAEDATHWIPQGESSDPVHDVWIACNDRRRLEERVLRVESGFAYSQDPPSRTCRVIGNVRIVEERDGELHVASNMILAEVRRERQQIYCGAVRHRLVRAGDGFAIRHKELRLVNSDVPLGNLTFLL